MVLPVSKQLFSAPSPMSSADHDADLATVRASLAGDEAANQRLVERLSCLPSILYVINKRGGGALDEESLADLGQDVWAILWRKRETFLGLAKIETWVFRIAALEYRNAVRGKMRNRERVEALGQEAVHDGQDSYEQADPEPTRHLLESLDRLGSPDADVIRLKHFEDRTFNEIGECLDTSPNTAKFWYYRGMDRLRQWLSPTLKEVLG